MADVIASAYAALFIVRSSEWFWISVVVNVCILSYTDWWCFLWSTTRLCMIVLNCMFIVLCTLTYYLKLVFVCVPRLPQVDASSSSSLFQVCDEVSEGGALHVCWEVRSSSLIKGFRVMYFIHVTYSCLFMNSCPECMQCSKFMFHESCDYWHWRSDGH